MHFHYRSVDIPVDTRLRLDFYGTSGNDVTSNAAINDSELCIQISFQRSDATHYDGSTNAGYVSCPMSVYSNPFFLAANVTYKVCVFTKEGVDPMVATFAA